MNETLMFAPQKLKECRESRNLTYEDLVFELRQIGFKVSRPTLENWENGITSPDAVDLAVLASFFKKPIQYFFVSERKQTAEVWKYNMRNSIVPIDQNMTLQEVADFMHITYNHAADTYMNWKSKYGITPLRYGRKILFSREEVLRSRQKAALV